MATRLSLIKNTGAIAVNFIKRNITMSAKLRSEEALKQLKESNPYFDKYAQKLAAVQQTSPEEFLKRAATAEKKTTKKTHEIKRDYSELFRAKESLDKAPETLKKRLEDIMKLDLVKDKTVDEIKLIWLEYHKSKDVIAATIDVAQYDLQMQRGAQYPVFIFPLPRTQGYEFIMSQFASNSIHFTTLLCYQVHKENAPECLNMVHYDELRDKGIILMRGEYDTQVLSAQEAQCLANQIQLYYGQHNESKIKLLEKFTKDPNGFKHMDVIKKLETLHI